MKKLLTLITIIFLSIALIGCNPDGFFCNINPDSDLCEVTYTPVTGDYTGTIQNKALLTVVDEAEDFDFTETSINTFSHQDNEDISYVDIEEFLFVLRGGLVNYSVSSDDVIEISYRQQYGLLSFYEYYLEFDPSENTLYYNDFNFSDSFNGNSSLEYDSDLYVSDYEYIEGTNLEKTIDLDDYGIITGYEDGKFFIPLYLANLLFTGSYLNVMELDTNMYIFDDFTLIQEEVEVANLEAGVNEANITLNTINYTSLFFDHFYGLKDFFQVESYKNYFINYGLYNVDNLEDFDTLFQEFIIELDDLHTSIYDFGYNIDNVNVGGLDRDSRLAQFLEVYYDDVCYLRDEEYIFTEYDTYYIMELNEFTLDTVDYLLDSLVNIDPDKPIYIDLSCNSGGSAIAVLEVLTYLSDQPIAMSYDIPATGESYIEYYELDESRKLDNDFYVFTSNMTYSAANLMTSMVLDDELATVIGTETTGGACAVLLTVLPNNLVLTHSSHMALTNQAGEIIEYGVSPDYYVNYSNSLIETIDYINTYYSENANFNATSSYNSGSHVFDLNFQSDSIMAADFELDKYIVKLYNTLGTVVHSEEFENPNFDFSYTGDDFSYAVVIIEYRYKGVLVDEFLESVYK